MVPSEFQRPRLSVCLGVLSFLLVSVTLGMVLQQNSQTTHKLDPTVASAVQLVAQARETMIQPVAQATLRRRYITRTYQPRKNMVTMGTVIRGNEWKNLDVEKNKAVMTSLHALSLQFGDQNIVLLVDEDSDCKTLPLFLQRAQCAGLEDCMHDTFRAPTMDCIFLKLWKLAKNDIVGFINGDILVFDSFRHSVKSCADNYENFVMVGRRHLSPVAFSNPTTKTGWDELEALVKNLPIDGSFAIDFFVVRKTARLFNAVFKDFPPFVIGTWRWDNYLLLLFIRDEMTVIIDATYVAPIVHQVFNEVEPHESRPAAYYNNELASSKVGNSWYCGTIDNANIILLNITGGTHDVSIQTWSFDFNRTARQEGGKIELDYGC